jgi:hypothetical protein
MEKEILELINTSLIKLEGIILSNGDKENALMELAALRAYVDYAIVTEDKTITMEDVELTIAEPDGTEGEFNT